MPSSSPSGMERSGASASLRSSRPRSFVGHALAQVDRLPPAATHAAAGLLVAVVAVLDAWTGTQLSFSIFYVIPVGLAAWRLGSAGGVVWAVVAGIVWLLVDVAGHRLPSAGVQYWNGGVRLATFLIIAASLAGMRRLWDAERTLAGTDYLTGVANGRAFHELVELERSRALRYNRPFTLAYMDVDGFKRINDELGHSQGDEALRLIATTIRDNMRSMDSVARLGGDEFALLLPETGPGAAEVALEKIREQLNLLAEKEALPLSFSIGAVICLGAPASADRLIQRADRLMYAVKQGGRNGLKTEVLNENFGIQAILQRS